MSSHIKVEVRVAWWLTPFKVLYFLWCLPTLRQPDKAVMRWVLNRAIKTKVIATRPD